LARIGWRLRAQVAVDLKRSELGVRAGFTVVCEFDLRVGPAAEK